MVRTTIELVFEAQIRQLSVCSTIYIFIWKLHKHILISFTMKKVYVNKLMECFMLGYHANTLITCF